MIYEFNSETIKKSMFRKDEIFMCTGFDLKDEDYVTLPMASNKKALYKLQKVSPLKDSRGKQTKTKNGYWYRVSLGGFKYI